MSGRAGSGRAFLSFSKSSNFNNSLLPCGKGNAPWCCWIAEAVWRRGELIGLQWTDIDFAKKQMNVFRSVVEMVAGNVKTEASRKAVPLDDFMIEELVAWYNITPYQKPEDWVFASDSPRAGLKRGKQPYWPSTIMRHFIQPVATKLGIRHMNWHTFRHTYSTLLHGNGEDPKVVQELLRHSSIKVTMDIYDAGSHQYQAPGAIAGDRDDRSKKEGRSCDPGLALHTVTWTDDARCM